MARTLSLRLRCAIAVMAVLLVLLGGRLFHLQALDTAGYATEAISHRIQSIDVPAERGNILDAQGRVLAGSVESFDIILDPRNIDGYTVYNEDLDLDTPVTEAETAQNLARILDMDVDEILAAFANEDTHYEVLARSVTPEQHEEVMALNAPGIYAEPRSERTYPAGPVAGSIVGFMGVDGPLEGLEAAANDQLEGELGERIYEVGADGVRIPNATYEEVAATDGDDIQLTVDQDIQWFAQEAIAAKADEYDARWANATVIDIETGAIVAMADSTTVNPQDPSTTDELFRRPLALTQDFEPGSVGKAITFATALEEGAVSPEDTFSVPDELTLNGQTIIDARPHETYEMTAAGIFARSYNTGTVMVGNQVDEQVRYDYMRKIGLGAPIDIGLGMSADSLLGSPEEWDPRQPLTTQFGQGYSASALHTAQVFQTLANDGVKMPLHIVDSTIDADGDRTEETVEGERIFSSETSEEMMKLMEGVVDHGSGSAVEVEGYRVGGKTGLAQAAGAAGGFDGYTQSFAGVAPLDDPKYVVAITMHRPQGDWSDWTVADTFSDVMSYTLASRDIAPSNTESESYDAFVGGDQERPW